MDGTLEDRLAALERAVTDGEHDCSALAEGAATADRVTELESDLADLTDRVAELEAATQALRGYVGNVRSVNSDVDERADLALSKAEAAIRAVDQPPGRGDEETPRAVPERREQQAPDRSGMGVSGPTSDPSGLEALRDPGDARSDRLRAMTGTETDGGQPGPRTDRGETSAEENGEQEPAGGVVSRVRSLL